MKLLNKIWMGFFQSKAQILVNTVHLALVWRVAAYKVVGVFFGLLSFVGSLVAQPLNVKITGPSVIQTPQRFISYQVFPFNNLTIQWRLRGQNNEVVGNVNQPLLILNFSGRGTDTLIVQVRDNLTGRLGGDTLIIRKNTCPAIAGFVSGNSPICTGSFATVQMDSVIGKTIRWQVSSNRTGPWQDVNEGFGQNQRVYISPLLNTSQYYRAIVVGENGVCFDTSDVQAIVVSPVPSGSFNTNLAEICGGDVSQALGATINAGNGRWETNGLGRFSDPTNPNARYFSSSRDAGTVRLFWVVESPGCPKLTFERMLRIIPPPSGGFDRAPNAVCPGDSTPPLEAYAFTGNFGIWQHDGKGFFRDPRDPRTRYVASELDAGKTVNLTWMVRRPQCDTVRRYTQPLRVVNSRQRAKIIQPLNRDTTVCRGELLDLRARVVFGNYFWISNQPINQPTTPYPSILTLENTSVTLVVIDAETKCQSRDTINIKVEGGSEINGKPITLCLGQSDTLVVTGAIADFNWRPVEGLNNPRSGFPIASPTKSTTYTYNARSANGCMSSGTLRVTVLDLPEVRPLVNDTTLPNSNRKLLCKDFPYYLKPARNSPCDVIHLFAADVATVKRNVLFNDATGAVINAAGLFVDSSRYYNSRLGAVQLDNMTLGERKYCFSCWTKANRCRGFTELTFSVVEKPKANFDVANGRNDVAFKDRTITFVNKTQGATSFFWSFGDTLAGSQNFSTLPNPTHTFTRSGFYTITLVADNGACSDPMVKTAFIRVRGEEFFFPNAFSPNGDGNNDLFRPIPVFWNNTESEMVELLRQIKGFNLKIFDLNNNLVFETNNAQGWNGKSSTGQDLDSGTYLFRATILQEVEGQSGAFDKVYTGTLNLIR